MSEVKERMINYLQGMLEQFIELKEEYGPRDEEVEALFNEMIACKKMTESIIGESIHLKTNGKVTVGG